MLFLTHITHKTRWREFLLPHIHVIYFVICSKAQLRLDWLKSSNNLCLSAQSHTSILSSSTSLSSDFCATFQLDNLRHLSCEERANSFKNLLSNRNNLTSFTAKVYHIFMCICTFQRTICVRIRRMHSRR